MRIKQRLRTIRAALAIAASVKRNDERYHAARGEIDAAKEVRDMAERCAELEREYRDKLDRLALAKMRRTL